MVHSSFLFLDDGLTTLRRPCRASASACGEGTSLYFRLALGPASRCRAWVMEVRSLLTAVSRETKSVDYPSTWNLSGFSLQQRKQLCVQLTHCPWHGSIALTGLCQRLQGAVALVANRTAYASHARLVQSLPELLRVCGSGWSISCLWSRGSYGRRKHFVASEDTQGPAMEPESLLPRLNRPGAVSLRRFT